MPCVPALARETELRPHIHEICEGAGGHFPHQLTSMGLNSDLANTKLETNLLIQQTTNDQPHDLPFTVAKRGVTLSQEHKRRLCFKCSFTVLNRLLDRIQ